MTALLVLGGAVLVPTLFVPASLLGEVAAKRRGALTRWVVALVAAGVLAPTYAAVLAVATDASPGRTLLTCLVAAVAVLGPTAVQVGVAHGLWSYTSQRRPRPAQPVS